MESHLRLSTLKIQNIPLEEMHSQPKHIEATKPLTINDFIFFRKTNWILWLLFSIILILSGYNLNLKWKKKIVRPRSFQRGVPTKLNVIVGVNRLNQYYKYTLHCSFHFILTCQL